MFDEESLVTCNCSCSWWCLKMTYFYTKTLTRTRKPSSHSAITRKKRWSFSFLILSNSQTLFLDMIYMWRVVVWFDEWILLKNTALWIRISTKQRWIKLGIVVGCCWLFRTEREEESTQNRSERTTTLSDWNWSIDLCIYNNTCVFVL